jgi:hypothetical protein
VVSNGAKLFLREILRRNKAGLEGSVIAYPSLMERATFDGMFASTLLTLFFVPVAYTLLGDLQIKIRNLLTKSKKQIT